MTDIERKRDYVTKLYKGDAWRKRVKKMSDSQVIAIYLKHQAVPKVQETKRNLGQDKLF